jgi:hypothetical protein
VQSAFASGRYCRRSITDLTYLLFAPQGPARERKSSLLYQQWVGDSGGVIKGESREGEGDGAGGEEKLIGAGVEETKVIAPSDLVLHTDNRWPLRMRTPVTWCRIQTAESR